MVEEQYQRLLQRMPTKTTQTDAAGDPLLGFTSPKEWFGAHRAQTDAWQRTHVAEGIGLDLKTFTALTETLIDIHRQRALVEAAGDDNALRSMQDLAITLYKLGHQTPESLQTLFAAWQEASGFDYPYGTQLAKFASAQKVSGAENGHSERRRTGRSTRSANSQPKQFAIDYTAQAREAQAGLNLPDIPQEEIEAAMREAGML